MVGNVFMSLYKLEYDHFVKSVFSLNSLKIDDKKE